jgi:nitrate reductase beta subunit
LTPVAVENFRVLQEAQQADSFDELAAENPLRGRVNLLNWDGKGMPEGMFPDDDRSR